jgi:hypothetical protein
MLLVAREFRMKTKSEWTFNPRKTELVQGRDAMSGDQQRLADLQIRRQELAASRRRAELRKSHGAALVDRLNRALGLALCLDDFKVDASAVDRFDWPTHLQDAPGLVAAYQERPTAATLLSSIDQALPSIAGKIGFHGKDYLGLASVSGVRASQLLVAAEAVKDSVLLLVERPAGALLVDYYCTPGRGPVSVVAQGSELIGALKTCFASPAQRPETR